MLFPLDRRKEKILCVAVQEYILTAEPVGSRRLVEKYGLSVSSATVRNELAILEETGYLTQPHTSAGRIPTDEGYRVYVDSLAGKAKLTSEEGRSIKTLFSAINIGIEDLMQETSSLLTKMTNYISVVLAPTIRRSRLKHLDLVSLSKRNVLMVLITDTGSVVKRSIHIDKEASAIELFRVESALNKELQGRTLEQIAKLKKHVVDVLSFERTSNRDVSSLGIQLLDEVSDSLAREEQERVLLGGTSSLLHQPEFEDLEKVQALFMVLEKGYLMLKWLEETRDAGDVLVKIGSENEIADARDYSLVVSGYSMGGETCGTLGIIGPTRMDYSRAIAAVECIAGNLSEALDMMRA